MLDVGEAAQELMSLGLLRAAWRPSGEVCVVRAVARQREAYGRLPCWHAACPCGHTAGGRTRRVRSRYVTDSSPRA
ncbi:hypothetical protein E1J61_28835 [Cupriavidus sp. L7L]|nr:hypothetical protein E1J61_28835 [Cupriavidus sp. L7L]